MSHKPVHAMILVVTMFIAANANADPGSIEQLSTYRQKGIEAGRHGTGWPALV